MRVLTCNSPYGRGGLGQHFAQLVEESRHAEVLDCYYTPTPKPDDGQGIEVSRSALQHALIRYTPVRFSTSWRSFLYNECFDRQVARRIDQAPDRLMGFAGEVLHCFRTAAALGSSRLELVSPTNHIGTVQRQHDVAYSAYPVGRSWLNSWHTRKIRSEYAMADLIYVHSEHARQSFIKAGIPPDTLRRTYLKVHPRFRPPQHRPDDDTFRLVFVGRIDTAKGVPLLLEAFDRFPITPKQLTIVGGWSDRSTRKHMEQWMKRDDLDLKIAPGDPVPALHQADVFAYPTYDDGFGYAPMEALACGVPVIVTEDTGMKEYVHEGENGYVIPTGDRTALLDRLLKLYHKPLAASRSLLSSTYAEERATLPALSDVTPPF